MNITGGCFCEKVRYDVSESPLTQFVCHCNGCLNRTGLYTGILFVPKRACVIAGACDVYRTEGGSGSDVETWRCSCCGALVGLWASVVPEMWLVAASSRDDAEQFNPEFHNWVSSKPSWIGIDDELPQFEQSVDWEKLGGRQNFGMA